MRTPSDGKWVSIPQKRIYRLPKYLVVGLSTGALLGLIRGLLGPVHDLARLVGSLAGSGIEIALFVWFIGEIVRHFQKRP